MIHCPYIREVINDLSCEVWRVRLMRLRAGGVISPHKDNLQCHSIVRLHLPILTNDEVEFRIEEKPYHLTAGNLYFTTSGSRTTWRTGRQLTAFISSSMWMRRWP